MQFVRGIEEDSKPQPAKHDWALFLCTGMSTDLVGQRLWGLFRCLISNTIEQFRAELGDMADVIMLTLEESINTFLIQALQIDSFTLELEVRQNNDSSG